MGKYFSDKTEEGIRLVWMQFDKAEIKRGADLLKEAGDEGDPDALYFLSRCFMGSCYVWKYAGLKDDDSKSEQLMIESIMKGSAAGVLGSMRCSVFTPEVKAKMPFTSLKEAWDMIYQKAEEGHPFCQYLIGNTYYYGDILEIDETINVNNYASAQAMEYDLVSKCIPWFEKSMNQGLSYGALNLYNLYKHGEHGIKKSVGKANEIARMGAKRGWPTWLKTYADLLYDEEMYEESIPYYKEAAEKGQMNAWFDIGYQYEFGQGVQKEELYALECYERAAKSGVPGAMQRAGRCYFFGYGTAIDYALAANWLMEAAKKEYRDSYALLGECLLKGLGIQKDYTAAKHYFENAKDCNMVDNGLGEIYADGLGVPEDIKRGVEFLEKAAQDGYKPAVENLSRFKKTLFGKWVRK